MTYLSGRFAVTLALLLASSNGQSDSIPIETYKAYVKLVCDPTDYSNCDDFVPKNIIKRNYPDLYESNTDDENLGKYIADVFTMEEKRDIVRPGHECTKMNDYIDLGPVTFPRYVKNVTCHTKQSQPNDRKCRKGYHCHPINYQIRVLTRRTSEMDLVESNDRNNALIPINLRQCWKEIKMDIVAGCVCGVS